MIKTETMRHQRKNDVFPLMTHWFGFNHPYQFQFLCFFRLLSSYFHWFKRFITHTAISVQYSMKWINCWPFPNKHVTHMLSFLQVEQIATIMQDDINILQVYGQVRALEAARTRALERASDDEHELKAIEISYEGVPKLALDFENRLFYLGGKSIDLAQVKHRKNEFRQFRNVAINFRSPSALF